MAVLPMLAACQLQEEEGPGEGVPFEILAPTGETRTITDGMQTRWLAGDRLTVIHAPAGSAAYVPDGPFTVDDPSTGHAAGTVYNLVSGGASDWYLAYPYKASNTRPDKLTLVLGSATDDTQLQAGYGTTEHLSGENFPLWGKGTVATAGGVIPSVSMHPLLSAIGVRVTNEGPVAVTLRSVAFTAPVPLVGRFSVDITGDEPVTTPVSTNVVSETATLTVSGGAVLAVGETAVLYLGLRPFKAVAGESLTLEVKASDSGNNQLVTTKSVTLEQTVNFAPGHIRYLNLGFSSADETLLGLTVPGVYGLDGADYVYTAGQDQLAVRKYASTVTFRLLSPSARKAVEVAGFPLSPEVGGSTSITLSLYEGNTKTSEKALTLTVLKLQDNMAWCQSADGTGIILQYQ